MAIEVAQMLQWSGRLQPAEQWIDGLREAAEAEKAARSFDWLNSF
jgi:hypothetical protein